MGYWQWQKDILTFFTVFGKNENKRLYDSNLPIVPNGNCWSICIALVDPNPMEIDSRNPDRIAK